MRNGDDFFKPRYTRTFSAVAFVARASALPAGGMVPDQLSRNNHCCSQIATEPDKRFFLAYNKICNRRLRLREQTGSCRRITGWRDRLKHAEESIHEVLTLIK